VASGLRRLRIGQRVRLETADSDPDSDPDSVITLMTLVTLTA